jgi:prevent-host-death family protein
MIEVSIADARRRLPELMRLSEAGERIVITRRGKPVGEVVQPRPHPVRKGLDLEAIRKDLALLKPGSDSLPSLLKMRREARY